MGFVKFLLNVIFCKFSKLRQNKNTAIPKNLQTNFRGRTRKLLNKDWKANFLARAARPARAARAARAAHRLNIAWSSSKKPLRRARHTDFKNFKNLQTFGDGGANC